MLSPEYLNRRAGRRLHQSMLRTELNPFNQRMENTLAKMDGRRQRDAIAAARRAVKALGFSLEEVLDIQPEKDLRRAFRMRTRVSVTFRNPDNPQETWSGRGRRPAWLIQQLKAGKSRDDLRI